MPHPRPPSTPPPRPLSTPCPQLPLLAPVPAFLSHPPVSIFLLCSHPLSLSVSLLFLFSVSPSDHLTPLACCLASSLSPFLSLFVSSLFLTHFLYLAASPCFRLSVSLFPPPLSLPRSPISVSPPWCLLLTQESKPFFPRGWAKQPQPGPFSATRFLTWGPSAP
uniref:cDNA FLJ42789 fis, clone BRAWH3007221 n=1 Tax=Homo sapiens TaxID=9606 RepID=Q6ZVB8_HUMAN|nr:unnamed protein product [Homo sapiens]